MRYAASEKLEIIRLVEGSHLSARQTLAKLGIPRTTFYRWYDRYRQHGEAGLQDQSPRPKHVWNRIPDQVRRKVVKLALKETELSPRELAVTFTDRESYFVSEASVYRVLKAHDLITSPAFIVIKASNEFKDKTTANNQLWQTDFTYLKVLGWGWFYLSTILDDYSRYIISLHQYEGGGCHGHLGPGFAGFRLRPGSRRSQAASAERQRIKLRLWRFGGMVAGQRNEAQQGRTLSSPDTGQN